MEEQSRLLVHSVATLELSFIQAKGRLVQARCKTTEWKFAERTLLARSWSEQSRFPRPTRWHAGGVLGETVGGHWHAGVIIIGNAIHRKRRNP